MKLEHLLSHVHEDAEREKLAAAGLTVDRLTAAVVFAADDDSRLRSVIGEVMAAGEIADNQMAEIAELHALGGHADITTALEDLDALGIDTTGARSALSGLSSVAGAEIAPSGLPLLQVGMAAGLPPVRPSIIPGLVRKEVTVLAAPGGGAKSAYALTLALAVVHEDAALIGQQEIKRAGKVLLISNEDSFADITKRSLANAKAHGYTAFTGQKHRLDVLGNDHAVLFERRQAGGPFVTTALYLALLAIEDYALIVVDTLASVCSGIEENDAGDMTRVVALLLELARATDAAVLVLHHVAKAGADRSANAVRGSGAITNSVRNVFGISQLTRDEAAKFGIPPDEAARYARLEIIKGNHAPAHQPLFFEKRGVSILVDDPDDPTGLPSENIVALVPVDLSKMVVPVTAGIDFAAIIKTLREGYGGNPDHPFSGNTRSGARSIQSLLTGTFGISPEATTAVVAKLLDAGAIAIKQGRDPLARKARQIVVVAADAEARILKITATVSAGVEHQLRVGEGDEGMFG
ncbi:AAA family ATPase [Bauldia litoralis]|uniref:RecA-family ATPase n=1 Tax=Bauldia litoralis TaxID=665467 RepID=A0A1G6A5Q6_9HYPH|nr:AAA family ATPase [Bauldia litoralis]SDB03739.1 RecA-family ATPase [Bauldia litoralis]